MKSEIPGHLLLNPSHCKTLPFCVLFLLLSFWLLPIHRTMAEVIKGSDGAEMVLVPAGEFWMGSDASDRQADDSEKPKHKVYLDAYYFDKYGVTNAQSKAFMDGKGYERRELWSAAGWQWRSQNNMIRPYYWNVTRWNESRQPVVGVSWYEADAFCRFAGKRLPTEAEREKAARGTDGRKYPWGNQWDSSRANSGESKILKTTPVGSYPTGVSPYGVYDLTGNVWEWVADWFRFDYYERSPDRNPKGPESGRYKALRGGSWNYLFSRSLRTAFRLEYSPDSRFDFLGFRCARSLS